MMTRSERQRDENVEEKLDPEDQDQNDDTGDGMTTVISSLTSNTGPSNILYPPVTTTFHRDSQGTSIPSPPALQRTTPTTTPAFSMKAVYARSEMAVQAGAAAAARDEPDSIVSGARTIEQLQQQQQDQQQQQQRHERYQPQQREEIEEQVPPLVPLARMPSAGKSVTNEHDGITRSCSNTTVTPPLPPQGMSRQLTPGAVSVPGIAATTHDQQQHDNLLENDEDTDGRGSLPSSAITPEIHPALSSSLPSYATPQSLPIVAELASSAVSYDDDFEDRLAERLEAQMTARLQQEVERRFSQERRQHAIAEVVEPKIIKTEHNIHSIGLDNPDMPARESSPAIVPLHVREEENFKICGIRRTCWGMILCLVMLLFTGGVVGTVLWFSIENNDDSASSSITSPTVAPSTFLPTTISPSESPTVPLEDRRWDYLVEEIGPIIVPAADVDPIDFFADPSTAQYDALEWMAMTDLETNVFDTPQVVLVERYVLATLYFTTGGPTNWTESFNFLSSESVCDWRSGDKGVFCTSTGPLVTSIVLSENGLQGPVPWELSLLEYLTQVQFDANALSGAIPVEFGSLTRLQSLWFKSNALTGALPAELASAINLESLDLEHNKIGSSLPPEWGSSLSNLFFLGLRLNEIVGTLPVEWQNLSNLRVLDLEGNQLDGNLPQEFGLLTQLTSLYLESNNFQGSLPTEYGNLTRLRNFFVYSNRLSGEMPTEYASLSSLDYFWFHDTDLTGSVDNIFCLFPQVENLRADCRSDGNGLPPQVNCSCCTSCCTSNGTNCASV
jgi:hypothetical protein